MTLHTGSTCRGTFWLVDLGDIFKQENNSYFLVVCFLQRGVMMLDLGLLTWNMVICSNNCSSMWIVVIASSGMKLLVWVGCNSICLRYSLRLLRDFKPDSSKALFQPLWSPLNTATCHLWCCYLHIIMSRWMHLHTARKISHNAFMSLLHCGD